MPTVKRRTSCEKTVVTRSAKLRKQAENEHSTEETTTDSKFLSAVEDRAKSSKSPRRKSATHKARNEKSLDRNINLEDSNLTIGPRDKMTTARFHEKMRAARPLAGKSGNILHSLHQSATGQKFTVRLRQALASGPLRSQLTDLKVVHALRPFERRCTALDWHPTRPSLLTVGSKGGEILVWDTASKQEPAVLPGIGPGGSIQALHFVPGQDTQLLTASIDGTVCVTDVTTQQRKTLLDTMDCHDHWYCSVDLQRNTPCPLVVSGRNNGQVTVTVLDGKEIWKDKVHKSKVTHVEFNPSQPGLFCTASLDRTCKLWDVRMLAGRKDHLHVLEHACAINSACFSPCGTQLLTTDQKNELRVYCAPAWHVPRTCITHPHRFFQHITPIKGIFYRPRPFITHPRRFFPHITPIKACWHPLADVLAVGRYPDDNCPGSRTSEPRTVDIFCARTGKLYCQLREPVASGIVSLSKFSVDGDRLATTMGMQILIWKRDTSNLEDCFSSLPTDTEILPTEPKTSRSNRTTGSKTRLSKTAPPKSDKTKIAKLRDR